MVWIGDWAPQGGSSPEMSHCRHRCHPASRRRPGSRGLLWFSSHDESTRGTSCQDLLLSSSSSIRSIRRSLGRDVTARLVSALVISRLDYCNSVLTHLLASTLAPLQKVLNAAVRLVRDLEPHDNVTMAMYELHWLPIAENQIQTLPFGIPCSQCASRVFSIIHPSCHQWHSSRQCIGSPLI